VLALRDDPADQFVKGVDEATQDWSRRIKPREYPTSICE
jgi:hypothetical protein